MKKFMSLLVVLCMVFMLASCGGKKKTNETPVSDDDAIENQDGDESDTEKSDEDNTDTGASDTGDTGSGDTGSGDTGSDTGDTGKPNDPCDPNPCHEKNKTRCTATSETAYVCECDRLTCEINGQCIADGERNPQNTCEICNRDLSKTAWSTVPDGGDCEGKDGLLGSGMCRGGKCGDYGTCDHRAYHQTAGMPCNRDVECESGFCYSFYDFSGDQNSQMGGFLSISVCTGTCKEDEDCPEYMTCQFLNTKKGYQCMPIVAAPLVGATKQDDFKPCNTNDDCKGGLCLTSGGITFCTSECSSSLLSDTCGDCGKCQDGGSAKGFPFDKYCSPRGSNDLGGACQNGHDCDSGGCYDNYCTVSCSGLLGSIKCTGNYECMEDVYAEGTKTCIDSTRFNMANGTPCNYDNQCKSGSCIEFEGSKICGSYCTDKQVTDPETGSTSTVKECADGSECIPVKNANGYADYICAQPSMLGREEFGEDCYADWQCAEGTACFGGYFCSIPCEKDDDCEIDHTCYVYAQDPGQECGEDAAEDCVPSDPKNVGVCLAREQMEYEAGESCGFVWSCHGDPDVCIGDQVAGDYYCTKECESDDDCFDIGGCYQGLCLRAAPYRSYIYGDCRFDDDCEKDSVCGEDGTCTKSCGADLNCEGYEAVVPTGKQKTCKPCETSTDCKTVFYDYGQCVMDYKGNKFCLEDCSNNPFKCPEGTRCNGYYCYPLSNFCEKGHAYCNAENNCAVPQYYDGWLCDADKECFSQICGKGFCQTGTCTKDSDCGCDMKECVAGSCVPKSSLGKMEVEPNDDAEHATTIVPGRTFAGFNNIDKKSDYDYFKISAKAGDYLKFKTHPFCGDNNLSTYIILFDADGVEITENEFMYYSQVAPEAHYFSEISDIQAAEDGDYYLLVMQHPGYVSYYGMSNAPYILEADVFTPDANDSCEGAKKIEPGTYHESLKHATNKANTTPCTGYAGYGADLFYKVTIPAKKFMTFRVTPESADFNASISILSGCGEKIEDVCLAGNAAGSFGNPEEVVFQNTEDSDKDYIIVVDSVINPLNYNFTIDFTIGDAPATPANDKIDGAIVLSGKGSIDGYTVSGEDDIAPTEGLCKDLTLDGKDVFYKFDMAAGDYFMAKIDSSYEFSMYIVKSDDLNNCLYADPYGYNKLTFEIKADDADAASKAGTYYLVVDTYADNVDFFTITYEKDHTDYDSCKGFAVYGKYDICSKDGTAKCLYDNNSMLYASSCTEYCESLGAVSGSGSCKTLYSESGSVLHAGCICDYDCNDTEKVQELCASGKPSNCTCGKMDPCGWKDNGVCNTECNTFFPTDHFDDAADCDTEGN